MSYPWHLVADISLAISHELSPYPGFIPSLLVINPKDFFKGHALNHDQTRVVDI